MTGAQKAAMEQAIGRFFLSFSRLEREIGEAVKVVLSAKQPGDLIVAALNDFARKVNTVKAGIDHALGKDGKRPSKKWRTASINTMNACFAINSKWRVLLSHASLRLADDGRLTMRSISIQDGTLRTTEAVKTAAEINAAADEMDKLAEKVSAFRRELTNYVFKIETGYLTFTGGDLALP